MEKHMQSELKEKLSGLKLLVVGVGGIGCEVLKYLSRYSFKEIHIIDMDVIEISNLNRQFYFRKEHIGKYKAETAKEVINKLAPHLNIIAHNKSIYEPGLGVSFVKDFDCVIMALDNIEARSYVSSLCCKTNVPLLESGSNGFKGQAYMILPGVTKCYDCYPQAEQKTFQVCTIRTTPTKFIHCLVWAKLIFRNLFTEDVDSSFDMCKSVWEFKKENKGKTVKRDVFYKLLVEHLEKLDEVDIGRFKKLSMIKMIDYDMGSVNNNSKVNKYIKAYDDSFDKILKNCVEGTNIKFDKDSTVHMQLVYNLAVLRAHIFNIPIEDVKKARQMIGNIIPAFSSTNSIVAGLMVMQMFKFFTKIDCYDKMAENDLLKLRSYSIYIAKRDGFNSQICTLEAFNPDCQKCNVDFFVWRVNFKETFNKLTDRLAEHFPGGSTIYSNNNLIYEPGLDDSTFGPFSMSSFSDMFIDTELNTKENEEVELIVHPYIDDDFDSIDESSSNKTITLPTEQERLKKPIVLTLIRSKDTAPQFEQINPGSKEIYKALYNREKEIFKKQKQAYQKVKKNRTMTSSSIKPKSVTKVFSIKSSLKKPSKAKKQLECGVIIVD